MSAKLGPGARPVKMEIPRPVRERLGEIQAEVSASRDRGVTFGEVFELLIAVFDAVESCPPCPGCGALYRGFHRPGCPVGPRGATSEGGTDDGAD